jgi:hypothetical protein
MSSATFSAVTSATDAYADKPRKSFFLRIANAWWDFRDAVVSDWRIFWWKRGGSKTMTGEEMRRALGL